MKKSRKTRKAIVVALSAMALLSGSALIQSCDRDLLDYEPSFLGNSIYERLQEGGKYSYTLRLIDDLNQTEVLSKTGSRTIFVADDDAYETFFQNNSWGVKKYEELSTAQKKMLLNSSMIKNAYLIELLSSVSDNPPQTGQCMRRKSGVSVYDSIARIYPDQMPATQYWARYNSKPQGIVLMRDNSEKPMIHFLPAYMQLHNITGSDLSKLTNGVSTSIDDAWVNGKKVIERDVTCKNGYIHFVDGVMTSSDNMAEIIGKHPDMSIFSNLMNEFCAPYYNDAATKEYNRLYDNSDSVFVLRYFAETTPDETLLYGDDKKFLDPDGNVVDAQLAYDPGWNQYIYSNTSGKDLHYDAGAILVPNNKAMTTWWNGDGKALRDMYHEWANVPLKTIVKLLNINMLNAFSETVPSKFDNIVDNTTKVSIHINPEDVDSCFMGCNGVVYLINKVFSPAAYSSVSFPALVNENTMNVIYYAISEYNFEPYLNSMDSKYGFFLPTNDAMLTYIDPCSYGSSTSILYQFYYDDVTKTVKARLYNYDIDSQTIMGAATPSEASTDQVKNRLTDLLNNCIVVLKADDDQMKGCSYYKTKSGGYLKIENAGTKNMTVAGALQSANNQSVPVDSIYPEKNGQAYVLTQGLPLTAKKSAYAILKEHDESSVFAQLLFDSGLLSQKMSGKTCADYNVNLFDAYNYTIYAPTSARLNALHDAGILPFQTDIDALKAEDFGGDALKLAKAKTAMKNRLINFVKYHIQDNSLMIGARPIDNSKYETFTINDNNKRYYSVQVTSTANSMTVTDQLGNERTVDTTPGLYNNQGREYWIEGGTTEKNNIYNASDVVVHVINEPLFYHKDQLTKWTSLYQTSSGAKSNVTRR